MIYGQILSPAQLGVRKDGDQTPRLLVDSGSVWSWAGGDESFWVFWDESTQGFVLVYPNGVEKLARMDKDN